MGCVSVPDASLSNPSVVSMQISPYVSIKLLRRKYVYRSSRSQKEDKEAAHVLTKGGNALYLKSEKTRALW